MNNISKPLPTPLELRSLPIEKRVTPLVKLFFWKAILDPMVSNKKLSSTYWRIYRFLGKQEGHTIGLLYDYLWSIEVSVDHPKQPMSMTEIFHEAAQWNTKQRMETNGDSGDTVEEYRNFLDILKEW